MCVCVCARTLPPPPPPPPDDKNNNRHSRVIFVTATIPLPSTAVAASRRRFCKVKYTYWQRRWRSDATLRRTKREQNKKYIKKNNTGKWEKKKINSHPALPTLTRSSHFPYRHVRDSAPLKPNPVRKVVFPLDVSTTVFRYKSPEHLDTFCQQKDRNVSFVLYF